MKTTIRRVRPGDEEVLSHIQTESWKAAFGGILSAEALAKHTDRERIAGLYRRLLEAGRGNGYILSVADRPHCIAFWDAARDASLTGAAELICIHSLPDNWRKGYGSAMMDRVLQDMRAAGYAEAVLWVFRDNLRARAFYEAKGFSLTERTKADFGPTEVLYALRL